MMYGLLLYFSVLFSLFFFFKQKTAYEMRISDWSSDVCSSDLDTGAIELLCIDRRHAAGRMHDQIDRETRSIAVAGAAHAKAVAFAPDGRDGSFCIELGAQLARLPHQPADEILIEGRPESRPLLADTAPPTDLASGRWWASECQYVL